MADWKVLRENFGDSGLLAEIGSDLLSFSGNHSFIARGISGLSYKLIKSWTGPQTGTRRGVGSKVARRPGRWPPTPTCNVTREDSSQRAGSGAGTPEEAVPPRGLRPPSPTRGVPMSTQQCFVAARAQRLLPPPFSEWDLSLQSSCPCLTSRGGVRGSDLFLVHRGQSPRSHAEPMDRAARPEDRAPGRTREAGSG